MTARYLLKEFIWPAVRAGLVVAVIAGTLGAVVGVIEMLNERPRAHVIDRFRGDGR